MKAQARIEVLDVEEETDFGLPHADTVIHTEVIWVNNWINGGENEDVRMVRLWILHRPGAE